jgi:hypothetical protein
LRSEFKFQFAANSSEAKEFACFTGVQVGGNKTAVLRWRLKQTEV